MSENKAVVLIEIERKVRDIIMFAHEKKIGPVFLMGIFQSAIMQIFMMAFPGAKK